MHERIWEHRRAQLENEKTQAEKLAEEQRMQEAERKKALKIESFKRRLHSKANTKMKPEVKKQSASFYRLGSFLEAKGLGERVMNKRAYFSELQVDGEPSAEGKPAALTTFRSKGIPVNRSKDVDERELVEIDESFEKHGDGRLSDESEISSEGRHYKIARNASDMFSKDPQRTSLEAISDDRGTTADKGIIRDKFNLYPRKMHPWDGKKISQNESTNNSKTGNTVISV